MADFNTNVPLWGNKGTKPSDGLLKDGYAPNDRPTAQNTNFMYNAFSNAIKEVQDNVPLEANILNKTGDVIGGTILSAPKQIKYSINKGNAKVQGNVNHFSNVSGDSKITITIPKDVVIPGRQTLVFSFLHSFKGGVINLDFSSTYVSDFATTNTDNIKNDEYRKVRLSFTLGENAHNADIVIVMSARERNLFSCTIAEDFVTSGLIGVPYSLKADSLIALDEGAMLPKETLPKLDCNVIRTPYIGYTTNAVNAPQREKLGTLMVFVTAETSKLFQVFVSNESGKVYTRTSNIEGSFLVWQELLTNSALSTALSSYATKEELKSATAGMLTESDATRWQKVKLSNDDGTSLSVPPAIKDWLLITDSGNYAINTDYVPENRPPSGTYFSLTVLIRDSRSRVLLAYDIERTNNFIRTMVGGKWRAWEQFGIDKEAKNYQKQKITSDNGLFYYNLTDNKSDILASVASESGFKTGYAHFTVLNGLGNNRSFRFTSYYYPTNGYIHAVDTAGQSHIRVCNGGVWDEWKSLADTSVTQNVKITNDDGSAITVSGYDLLDVEDVKSYDGYVTMATNSPTGASTGYFKRKYRAGYIEVSFAPHSSKEVYRNSRNGATKKWVGWEKLATASEVSDITPVTLWEGSAQGGTGTYYKLKRPVTDFTRIKVWHSSSVYKYNVSEFYIPSPAESLDSFVIGATNLSNATGGSPTIYELGLDFSKVTSFTIPQDSRYNIVNSEAILKSNSTIIQKIEGIVK